MFKEKEKRNVYIFENITELSLHKQIEWLEIMATVVYNGPHGNTNTGSK